MEKTLNKKLDGEWSLQTINNAIDSNFSQTILFSKKDSGGNIHFTTIDASITTNLDGIYELIKSSTLTIAFPNGKDVGYPYDTETYEIVKYTKTELTLKRQKNNFTYFYKKM